MCDCACNCCCPTAPPDGDEGGGGTTPPRCTRYRLTIDSINVTSIDDGFLGGNLEVTFTFTVKGSPHDNLDVPGSVRPGQRYSTWLSSQAGTPNGQAQNYVNNDLGTGITTIGMTFFVDVPTDTSTIALSVSGVEHDPFFDDPLAGFTAVWGQAQNWGLGFQTGSASDSNITYTLNYTITCARSRDVTISRDTLIAYGRAKAAQRRVEASDTALASWALSRFGRDTWEVVQASGDQFVLRGYGALPILVEQRLAEERPG
jgi:hypothetical protein